MQVRDYAVNLGPDILDKKLTVFYLNNKEDLGNFIANHYKGQVEYIKRIPIGQWFVYEVDDSGDYIYDNITLLNEYKRAVIKTIIDLSTLYKFLDDAE